MYMKTMLMLKLGPLILIVNLFFSISVFAEINTKKKLKMLLRESSENLFFQKLQNLYQIPLFWTLMKMSLRLVIKKEFW